MEGMDLAILKQRTKSKSPQKIQKSHQTKTKCFQNLQKPSGIK